MDGAERLAEWVAAAAERNPDDLPAFPGVAARLVDLLEQPDAEVADVESLVAQDQVVSAQVLRMANSVVYSGAMPVETVAQAVLRLGFRETAQVSMAAACRSLFSIEDRAELEVHPGMWRGLWLDSLVCAYGGRLIAQELGFGVPERVFLCAMFRNLGELVILKVVAGGVVRGELRTTPDEETLRRVADRLHTELGARYLAACRLPDYVVAAAARHHDAGVPFDAAHADLHAVRLTEGLCARIGIGPCPAGELGPLAEETAACLGLAPERLAFFALQLEELAGQLKEIA